jgi:hypothetical protein
MSNTYKISKVRLAQIIKEEYEFVRLELEEEKKPDDDGDGVPDWADEKPGKDDHADEEEEEETQTENVNMEFLRRLIHSEMKGL